MRRAGSILVVGVASQSALKSGVTSTTSRDWDSVRTTPGSPLPRWRRTGSSGVGETIRRQLFTVEASAQHCAFQLSPPTTRRIELPPQRRLPFFHHQRPICRLKRPDARHNIASRGIFFVCLAHSSRGSVKQVAGRTTYQRNQQQQPAHSGDFGGSDSTLRRHHHRIHTRFLSIYFRDSRWTNSTTCRRCRHPTT